MGIGYIWPVLEEWGKEAFEKRIISHYDYGYSISRFPQIGDVIVFYLNKELLGSVPVDSAARPTTAEDVRSHPYWALHWKYIMGLDGTRKVVFSPHLKVEDIADYIAVLRGKHNLHAVCRNAPKITMTEYNLIISRAEEISKVQKRRPF